MENQQKAKIPCILFVMIAITLFLVAGVIVYFSRSAGTGETLTSGRNTLTLNGPWKFIVGDNMHYADSGYDDSGWRTLDLTALPGAHDGDVGFSGYVPGWTAKGYSDYSGYAWYRLKIPVDSLPENNLALAAPPAVDDAYQLFGNGSLLGDAGDFSGTVPVAYSTIPRMFLLPEHVRKGGSFTIAFRVWMSPTTLDQGSDLGGIHIAPTLGEKRAIQKIHRFRWDQTIKGYIVEVVLPAMFVLLAITMLLLNRSGKQDQSCRWFIRALVLVGLVRLNQASYAWFQIESTHQSDIIGTVILRPLVLGSWVMAWRDWFDLRQSKWLPKIVAILTLLFTASQLLGLSWVSNTMHIRFQTLADDMRLLFLALMLFVMYRGVREQGPKESLALSAMILVTIALYPTEVSALHMIPGIWFPYGVGVSRGQYFYAVFVFVMYAVLIRKTVQNGARTVS